MQGGTLIVPLKVEYIEDISAKLAKAASSRSKLYEFETVPRD